MSENIEPQAQLSKRELEVLTQVATGASNRQIADALVLSIYTVKTHIRNIHSKLGVQSRTEAAMLALQKGWIAVPSDNDPASNNGDDSETVDSLPETDHESPADSDAVTSAEGDEPPTGTPMPPVTNTVLLTQQRPLMLAGWQQIYLTCALVLALLVMLVPMLPDQDSPIEVYQPGPILQTGVMQGPVAPTPAPPAPKNWAFHAPLHSPRAYLSAVVYGDDIYAIGGVGNDNQAIALLERYTPKTNQWTTQSLKPNPAANMAAAVHDDQIYIPGGCDGNAENVLDTLDIYDPNANSWTVGPSLPEPRCLYGLTVFEDELYLFGGWDGQTFRDTIFALAPNDDAWRPLAATLPQPMGSMGVTVFSQTIYLAGGYDGQAEFKQTYTFEPSTETWMEQTPLQAARGGLGLVATPKQIYAIGGGWNEPVGFSEVYDPATNQWNTFATPFDNAWRNMAVVGVDTEFYALGGRQEQAFMNAVTSYQYVHTIFIPFSSFGQN